jgi:ribosomal protein S18 acetylase RimI-like enzyme
MVYSDAVPLRAYQPADFAALYAVEELCFQPPFRFSRALMRELVADPDSATWIAEEEGQMAGFAIVQWGREGADVIAYLKTIEVLPALRARGLGAELLAACERSARAAGASLLWLHVDEENAGAIRLYQRHGYVFEGRQERFYPQGRAALIGAKVLGPGRFV